MKRYWIQIHQQMLLIFKVNLQMKLEAFFPSILNDQEQKDLECKGNNASFNKSLKKWSGAPFPSLGWPEFTVPLRNLTTAVPIVLRYPSSQSLPHLVTPAGQAPSVLDRCGWLWGHLETVSTANNMLHSGTSQSFFTVAAISNLETAALIKNKQLLSE